MDYNVINFTDWLLVPFYLFFVFLFARFVRNKHIDQHPEYRYYLPGLTVKIIGAVLLALVYTTYYPGGDTVGYFLDGLSWNKLLFESPAAFLKVFIEGSSESNYYLFSEATGYPLYWRADETNYVVRFSFLAGFLGARSFLVASILFAVASFEGIWRLFVIYANEFPKTTKGLAISFLFIPSVIFWGSGILKDTVTISCIGYFFAAYYKVLIKREKVLINIIIIFISAYLILKIKPYIFVALLPAVAIWTTNQYLARIRGSFTRFIIAPLSFILIGVSAFVVFTLLSSLLKAYSLENILEKAVTTQRDLKSDYYEGNAFDIGELEPTVSSFLAHSHKAINAALFRPYIWEANNLVMFISGVEDLWFLLFTLVTLFRVRVLGIFSYFTKNPLLTFGLVFSLFFAFSVGISASNFGSMVRYRIPLRPFFISSLFIINSYVREKRLVN
ncbi:MAG: hypothetical protein IT241_11100 [Bacteroidia bacterium]|nr:hypothetical protein [Bacteroidia bacterium]